MTPFASVFAHDFLGQPLETATTLIVWGHGWGHNRHAFAALMPALTQRAAHLTLDFPGFGQSPLPPMTWDTAAYADALAPTIRDLRAQHPNLKRVIWVGHSFGGRVGVQLGARHAGLFDGLFLIAAAGLQRPRNPLQKLRFKLRLLPFKIMKILAPLLRLDLDKMREKMGSADYRNAGAMRPIFVTVIREDLSETARKITCPVSLVYGEKDNEAPPVFGEIYARAIPQAQLSILPNQDHYSLLGVGAPLVTKRLIAFLDSLQG